MKRRKRPKSFNMGMLALFFICAVYLGIYPQVSTEEKSGLTSSFSSESTSYEKAENSAQVISNDAKGDEADAAKAAIEAIESKTKSAYSFRSADKLEGHYKKHGIEMGFSSETEYLEAANALINNPDALHKTEAEDGDDIYYLEKTNEIAFVSTDGYIRTYFICSGKAYYDRQ
ncbi:hypothetical protein [Butyrivibrio sp. LC3010]|uniref:hypothetical protein n=1 Tax=Butyrivibrio sp. LC3010 TaxID=1280680 RepID=UPI000400A2C1|nr:hypothetical protein [Butyrivibrio sp. LC3010]